MKKILIVFISTFLLLSTYNIFSQITIYPPHCDTLLWSKVIFATSYRAQVADNSLNIIYTTISTDTQYVLPLGVLIGGITYNMRVKPLYTADSGNWSNFYNFVFSAHLPPPVYLGIYIDTSAHTTTLFWTKIQIATSYTLQISFDSTFTNILINHSNIVDTFYTVPSPGLGIGVYYLRLRSSNSCGNGLWSPTYYFVIHPIPGIKKLSNEIPDKFELFQNNPNPFNPTTNIKYQLPKGSFVKLIVYNILGEEVATLVNEKLEPGIYEVEWDASNYPSGVYFYKLQAGDFTETKKMVMIK